MTKTKVVIVGAGLAGLNAARRLQRAGIDFMLFEARNRPGGRILTVGADGKPSPGGFDLGPSWVWPGRQPAIAALARELGVESFAQNVVGDAVFERMSQEAPRRISGLPFDQQSQRFVGGSAALVDALIREVPADRLHFGAKVVAMVLTDTGVQLTVEKGDATQQQVSAGQVILALPPRLLAEHVAIDPRPDAAVLRLWTSTPTWMAPHAKVFAVYDRPFWREAGFSGTAQSLVGPMAEIHDATTHAGQAALFGFVGVGASQRAALGEEMLKAACVQQFVRIFGGEAAHPQAVFLKDWAADPLTATSADAMPTAHIAAGVQDWIAGPWKARLAFAGSETSPIEAGYLAGAVEASEAAVGVIMDRLDEGMAF